jgi:O-acetyl-ADP-ribose deacetylase (regulator of RNase III)
MPIEYRVGDLFSDEGLPSLAHGCNCAGSMGRGIAVEFRRRWPAMYDAYRIECKEGRFQPGEVFVWNAADKTIFNLATQPVARPSARLEYIETALKKAVGVSVSRGITTIGMPRIGAGYGGLDWGEVRQVLEAIAGKTAVTLAVFERPVSGTDRR